MKFIKDQQTFMSACGQSVDRPNKEQTELYLRLMLEEFGETLVAANPSASGTIRGLVQQLTQVATLSSQTDRVELFDGLLDVIVTTAGAGISAGLPMSEGWKEVMRSNLAKIDPETGEVTRRSDGKILKPEGWTPPNLSALLSPV